MTEYEKQKLTFVSKELKLRIENVVLDCLDKAQARFGVSKVTKIPKIRYDTTGTSGGLACWNGGEPWIKINPILLNENVERMVNQTVPHEVAHCVVFEVYEGALRSSPLNYGRGRRAVAPHGWEWQQVMRLFGKEPERCHDMDVSSVKKVRNGGREFQYKCDCMVHNLTIVKHNRISIKGLNYTCRRCGSRLVFDKSAVVV